MTCWWRYYNGPIRLLLIWKMLAGSVAPDIIVFHRSCPFFFVDPHSIAFSNWPFIYIRGEDTSFFFGFVFPPATNKMFADIIAHIYWHKLCCVLDEFRHFFHSFIFIFGLEKYSETCHMEVERRLWCVQANVNHLHKIKGDIWPSKWFGTNFITTHIFYMFLAIKSDFSL